MGNVVEAQIFKRANRGDRETVRMRLYALDGTPCEMDKLYDGSSGGGGLTAEDVISLAQNEIVIAGVVNEQGVREITADVLAERHLLSTGFMLFAGEWGPQYTYDAGSVVSHNGQLYLTADDVTGGDLSSWLALNAPNAWANLTLNNNLNWMTQDVAQWRRNGDRVELRGTFRKLFGNSTGTGMNDFANALPEEHWPSRNTNSTTILSDSAGYHPMVLQYTTAGRLEVGPDASYTDPVVYLDGVFFDLS